MSNNTFALGEVPILDLSGTMVATIRFTNDPGLFARFLENQGALLAVFSRLGNASITPEGLGKDSASQAVLDRAESEFSALIDQICGCETAQNLFQNIRPFAVLQGGVFWAQVVLQALGQARQIIENNIRT